MPEETWGFGEPTADPVGITEPQPTLPVVKPPAPSLTPPSPSPSPTARPTRSPRPTADRPNRTQSPTATPSPVEISQDLAVDDTYVVSTFPYHFKVPTAIAPTDRDLNSVVGDATRRVQKVLNRWSNQRPGESGTWVIFAASETGLSNRTTRVVLVTYAARLLSSDAAVVRTSLRSYVDSGGLERDVRHEEPAPVLVEVETASMVGLGLAAAPVESSGDPTGNAGPSILTLVGAIVGGVFGGAVCALAALFAISRHNSSRANDGGRWSDGSSGWTSFVDRHSGSHSRGSDLSASALGSDFDPYENRLWWLDDARVSTASSSSAAGGGGDPVLGPSKSDRRVRFSAPVPLRWSAESSDTAPSTRDDSTSTASSGGGSTADSTGSGTTTSSGGSFATADSGGSGPLTGGSGTSTVSDLSDGGGAAAFFQRVSDDSGDDDSSGDLSCLAPPPPPFGGSSLPPPATSGLPPLPPLPPPLAVANGLPPLLPLPAAAVVARSSDSSADDPPLAGGVPPPRQGSGVWRRPPLPPLPPAALPRRGSWTSSSDSGSSAGSVGGDSTTAWPGGDRGGSFSAASADDGRDGSFSAASTDSSTASAPPVTMRRLPGGATDAAAAAVARPAWPPPPPPPAAVPGRLVGVVSEADSIESID